MLVWSSQKNICFSWIRSVLQLLDWYSVSHNALQLIAVLKLLVENTHVPLEDVMSIDISSTMLALARFIARYSGTASFRVKIKFCIMCDSVCERADTLTLRKDTAARHEILDIIMEWIQPTLVCPSHSSRPHN